MIMIKPKPGSRSRKQPVREFPDNVTEWYSVHDANRLCERSPNNDSSSFAQNSYWAGQLNLAFRKGWEMRDQEGR